MTTPYGEEVAVLEGKGAPGLNSLLWDMRRVQGGQGQGPAAGRGGPPAGRGMARVVSPGDYVVTLEIGDKKWTKRATIRKMPGLD